MLFPLVVTVNPAVWESEGMLLVGMGRPGAHKYHERGKFGGSRHRILLQPRVIYSKRN